MTESEAIAKVKKYLTSDLLKPAYYFHKVQTGDNSLAGFCYIASEAFYHLMGGSSGYWEPHTIIHEDASHWLLKHKTTGEVLDITSNQFKTSVPYHKTKRHAFLTTYPSKRCRILLDRIKNNKTVCKQKGL